MITAALTLIAFFSGLGLGYLLKAQKPTPVNVLSHPSSNGKYRNVVKLRVPYDQDVHR